MGKMVEGKQRDRRVPFCVWKGHVARDIGGGASNGKSKRQKWECLGVQSPDLNVFLRGEGIQ
ncbi:hypothetical protein TIFTF001_013586 [Ficus carica]|uniref:Uncharacterized protein n=1 Tax=Ficus carica TaxID=3494 RepID=A0AA87ZY11_FICCA|nr:hypothetical protein TIFTF001_013586 [Ficus carica]